MAARGAPLLGIKDGRSSRNACMDHIGRGCHECAWEGVGSICIFKIPPKTQKPTLTWAIFFYCCQLVHYQKGKKRKEKRNRSTQNSTRLLFAILYQRSCKGKTIETPTPPRTPICNHLPAHKQDPVSLGKIFSPDLYPRNNFLGTVCP
jgi:hypothetical protein